MMYSDDVTSFYCMQYIVCVPFDVLFFESSSFLQVKYITTCVRDLYPITLHEQPSGEDEGWVGGTFSAACSRANMVQLSWCV